MVAASASDPGMILQSVPGTSFSWLQIWVTLSTFMSVINGYNSGVYFSSRGFSLFLCFVLLFICYCFVVFVVHCFHINITG